MDRIETLQVLSVIKAAYSNFHKGDAELTVNLWQTLFADDDYRVVQAAVKIFIATDTKGFPPVIGQIKEKIANMTLPNELTEQEAWNIIRKALNNCGYNYRKEWENLPESLRAMTSPGQMHEWSMMDSDLVNSVIASNFMRSYKARVNHNKEYSMLPNEIKSFSPGVSGQKSRQKLPAVNIPRLFEIVNFEASVDG
ncbi:MAG: hypothetical protein LBR74_07745 [Eubacterium sp.]|jgi:hypothetical protein|nr:hypothetical protein [Eubacterium sp.]